MSEQEKKIEELKSYCVLQGDVLMAFVFGSQAKGQSRATSDWDIAVYLTEESRDREQEIWAAVEKIVGAEVDLVVLNRAPATIAWTVLRDSITLVIKDRQLYFDFMFPVSDEANAWYETSRRYYRIFERSRSLTPEDADRLRRILTFLEEAVREYEQFQSMSQTQYLGDRVAKRNIEHWVEHLIISAVDIAEIILASERRPLPSIYRELMKELGTIAPFSQDDTCQRIAEWVRLRNMLTHEYLDYRWKELEDFVRATEPLFQRLIKATRSFLAKE